MGGREVFSRQILPGGGGRWKKRRKKTRTNRVASREHEEGMIDNNQGRTDGRTAGERWRTHTCVAHTEDAAGIRRARRRRTLNCAGNPSLLITLAYFLAASLASASVLAPVHTILPELNINAVVLGARMRMIAAAKRCVDGDEKGGRGGGETGKGQQEKPRRSGRKFA